MRSRRAAVLAPLVLVAAVLPGAAAAAPAAAGSGTVGSDTAGDPYFPLQGNGGYDVASYRITVRFDPHTKQLAGTTSVFATATQALSRFDLDLRRNLRVSKVTVNGEPSGWSQPYRLAQELVVTPRHQVAKGGRLWVSVTYAGRIHDVTDPDGSPDGFIATDDGGVVMSEPQGAPTWFPVNDTPHDKATYQVTATVPRGYWAISNGATRGISSSATTRTYRWQLDQPVSSYLVTLAVGKFLVWTGRTADGVPYRIAVDPKQRGAIPTMRKLPAIIDYFSSVYGRYPFDRAGAIVENAPFIGYALECATRPVFDRAPDVATLSHELAHQWYGDDVTLDRWRDIWLNEGFAEFSSWLWDEHTHHTSAAQHLRELLAKPASDTGEWNPPPGNPGSARDVFSGSVYDRGAGTLEALREKVGSTTFFAIMRAWLAQHRYGNGRVEQFTALAQQVAHRDLRHFFSVWLYRTGKPSGW